MLNSADRVNATLTGLSTSLNLMKPLYNNSPMFCVCLLVCALGVVGHLDRGDTYVSQWEWSILTRCFGDTWQHLNYMYKHAANLGNCAFGVGDTEGRKERERKEWFAWFHTQLLISPSIAVAVWSTVVLGCPALFISSQSLPEVLHNHVFFLQSWLKE